MMMMKRATYVEEITAFMKLSRSFLTGALIIFIPNSSRADRADRADEYISPDCSSSVGVKAGESLSHR